MRSIHLSIACLLGILLRGALAVADAPPDRPPTPAALEKEAARQHFDLGMKHYNLGDYDKAREEFKLAYLAKADPVFLFNIGQCARFLGEHEEAIKKYHAYLRERPDASNREEVEQLIKNSEHDLEVRQKTVTTTPAVLAPYASTPHAVSDPPPPLQPEATPSETPPPPSPRESAPPALAPSVIPANTGAAQPPPPAPRRWWILALVGGIAVVGAGIGIGIAYSIPNNASVPPTTLSNMMLP